MKRPRARDTIIVRLALTIMLAMSTAAGFELLFKDLGGMWAGPDCVRPGCSIRPRE